MKILVAARSLVDAENAIRMMVPDAHVSGHSRTRWETPSADYRCVMHGYGPIAERFDRALILMGGDRGPKIEAWIRDVVSVAMDPGGEMTVLM